MWRGFCHALEATVAKVRLIADEPRIVPWLGPERTVQPDEVVEVPDEQLDSYVCQPAVWELVAEAKPAVKRGSKDGD